MSIADAQNAALIGLGALQTASAIALGFVILRTSRRPTDARRSPGQEAPMPVSQGVTSALADVQKAAQTAINAAYVKGFADGQSGFTAEAEQDDTDTTQAVENTATAIGQLAPVPPAPNGGSGQ